MAIYRCGTVRRNPKITVVQRWTASGWSDVSDNKYGTSNFITPKKGLYLFVWGGNPLQISNGSNVRDNMDYYSAPEGFAALAVPDAQCLRPQGYSLPISGINTVFFKQCDAGESHSFNWGVSRWNRVGGTIATLILIEI